MDEEKLQKMLDAIRREADVRTVKSDEEWIVDEYAHMFGDAADILDDD